MSSSVYQRYFLPGFVFQSVIVAGGYGTGKELTSFFLSLGPLSGLLGLCCTMLLWSFVCSLTFLFAFRIQAYNYRHFFQALLGKRWVLFEGSYFMVIGLVLAVITASAGSILLETFRVPYAVGVALFIAYICCIILKGSHTVEKSMTTWAFALYLVFFCFLAATLWKYGSPFKHLPALEYQEKWLLNGLRYAGYNLGLIPAVLFCCRHARSKKEALYAGLLAGPLGILPAFFFFFAMLCHYPDIVDAPLPSLYLLHTLDLPLLSIAFHIVLFGTLAETGVGLLHALNERIACSFQEQGKPFSPTARVLIAAALLGITFLLSQVGLNNLITKGYSTLAWLMIAVYLLPLVLHTTVLALRKAL